MEAWLPECGIAYQWIETLGGRRSPSAHSPNVGLRNLQFRAYADYMSSDQFASGVSHLLTLAASSAVAVMCSESVWWRCHRRLLADHLVLARGTAVEHLFHDGRLSAHPATPGVTLSEGRLLYEPDP